MTQSLSQVMIVDDDVALRTAFAKALDRVGYDVVTTTGSPEILDLIAADLPALILMDNHMPGASGTDLIKTIRQQWSLAELPIVLVSGSSIQGEIDEAMKAGANDFRRKPIDLADLIATVQAAIATPEQSQPAVQGARS